MAIIFNFFGPPGAGKSTGAAYVFSLLKMNGVNCELVTEYAKDAVWEKNATVLKNQVKILGEQYLRLTRCENEVDVIVTDSPLLNSSFYNRKEDISEPFNALVLTLFNQSQNINYYIRRVRPYVQEGRTQTEAESDRVAVQIKEMLDKEKIPYEEYPGDIKSYEKIAREIIDIVKNKA